MAYKQWFLMSCVVMCWGMSAMDEESVQKTWKQEEVRRQKRVARAKEEKKRKREEKIRALNERNRANYRALTTFNSRFNANIALNSFAGGDRDVKSDYHEDL